MSDAFPSLRIAVAAMERFFAAGGQTREYGRNLGARLGAVAW